MEYHRCERVKKSRGHGRRRGSGRNRPSGGSTTVPSGHGMTSLVLNRDDKTLSHARQAIIFCPAVNRGSNRAEEEPHEFPEPTTEKILRKTTIRVSHGCTNNMTHIHEAATVNSLFRRQSTIASATVTTMARAGSGPTKPGWHCEGWAARHESPSLSNTSPSSRRTDACLGHEGITRTVCRR